MGILPPQQSFPLQHSPWILWRKASEGILTKHTCGEWLPGLGTFPDPPHKFCDALTAPVAKGHDSFWACFQMCHRCLTSSMHGAQRASAFQVLLYSKCLPLLPNLPALQGQKAWKCLEDPQTNPAHLLPDYDMGQCQELWHRSETNARGVS